MSIHDSCKAAKVSTMTYYDWMATAQRDEDSSPEIVDFYFDMMDAIAEATRIALDEKTSADTKYIDNGIEDTIIEETTIAPLSIARALLGDIDREMGPVDFDELEEKAENPFEESQFGRDTSLDYVIPDGEETVPDSEETDPTPEIEEEEPDQYPASDYFYEQKELRGSIEVCKPLLFEYLRKGHNFEQSRAASALSKADFINELKKMDAFYNDCRQAHADGLRFINDLAQKPKQKVSINVTKQTKVLTITDYPAKRAEFYLSRGERYDNEPEDIEYHAAQEYMLRIILSPHEKDVDDDT